jgi:hypothetical protein
MNVYEPPYGHWFSPAPDSTDGDITNDDNEPEGVNAPDHPKTASTGRYRFEM